MRLLRQVSWVFCFALAACAGKAPPPAPPVTSASDVELSLFLVGDGGKPNEHGEPVLEALTATMHASAAPSLVVFLGDNIYPAGLPPRTSKDNAEMERRLKDQIDAVVRTHARGIFVPGNHDWDDSGGDGWSAVRRQEAFIAEHGEEGRVVLLPQGGCPGPSVVDFGESLRLVAIDTEWWLRSNDKPGPSDCTPGTEQAVVEAIARALSERGERHAVVVAHHPLISSGPHGGYFNWQDHLFPTVRVWAPLWIPLPIIGSGYPLARVAGISSQDLSGSKNERMRTRLEEAFASDPPLIYAAGHEHTLEVLEGKTVSYIVVSGAGYYGHTSPTKWRDETLYQKATAGFMRLDLLRDGRLRLGVLTVDAEARVSEPFAIYLSAT